MLAKIEGKRIAVQCKNYAKAVGNKPVQEVYAGSRHHRCDQAWVVAPAGYTKGAHELAQSVGVLLFDANSIRSWIRQVDVAVKTREEVVPTPSDGGVQEQRAIAYPHPDDPASESPPARKQPAGSGNGFERDREKYETLLENYLTSIESLETYRDLRQLGQVLPGSDAEEQWDIALRMVNGNLRRTLAEMGEIEGRNSDLIRGEYGHRRAELVTRHSELQRDLG